MHACADHCLWSGDGLSSCYLRFPTRPSTVGRSEHDLKKHGPPQCSCLDCHSGPSASTGTARQNGLARYLHGDGSRPI